MSTATVFSGAIVITPDEILENAVVVVRGERIAYVGPEEGMPGSEPSDNPQSEIPNPQLIDLGGGYLLPGLIDTHLHGGGSCDCVLGRYDASTDEFTPPDDGVPVEIANVHARHGTTSVVLATTAAPRDALSHAVGCIGRAAESGKSLSRILGIHLEGTFLRLKEYSGAMAPQNFVEPSVEAFERFQDAASGFIKIVNIVPEYGEAGVELIRHVVSSDYGQGKIVAAAGHSGATREETESAIDAGLRLAVHFTNGPSSSSYKPPGAFNEATLLDDRVACELIADGWHVAPVYVMSILATKKFNCIGITDAMMPVDAPEIRSFEMFGKRAKVVAGPGGRAEVLRLEGSKTLLFGSALTGERGLRHITRWLEANRPGVYHPSGILGDRPEKKEALRLAAPLFTKNPAELLGVSDDLGSIAPGKFADLVHLDDHLDIRRVFVGGKSVYQAGKNAT